MLRARAIDMLQVVIETLNQRNIRDATIHLLDDLVELCVNEPDERSLARRSVNEKFEDRGLPQNSSV